MTAAKKAKPASGTSAAKAGGRAADYAESPLAWLAGRRDRDGRALIEPHQLNAGARLRADFTYGGLEPRMTVDWSSFLGGSRGGGRRPDGEAADTTLAARDRVRHALVAVGPELAGVLVDVCCFLKGLETVERERGWPPRSAKVVLSMGLDRLARHYGFAASARGRETSAGVRAWGADGFRPSID